MSRFHNLFVFAAFLFVFLVYTEACRRQPEQRRYIDLILSVVREALPKNSFEVYDFKTGWYNTLVDSQFDLPYSSDTVALSTFTIPGVFENAFIPFLCKEGVSVANDSWPLFSKYYMEKVQRNLMEKLHLNVTDEDILYPHIMLGRGHPLILVQTAAHVAGAAYYYQRKNIINDPWPEDKKIYGISLHPKYGGWFYMGPVIILRDVKFSGMQEKQVEDVLIDEHKKIELLNLVNGNWSNQKWRDVINVVKNYTDEHLAYRMSYGSNRATLVKTIYNDRCKNKGIN